MRGNAQNTKVHYKGKEDDFVIFVESAKAVQEWKRDKSVPLAQVVNGWKIFCTHKYALPDSRHLLEAIDRSRWLTQSFW